MFCKQTSDIHNNERICLLRLCAGKGINKEINKRVSEVKFKVPEWGIKSTLAYKGLRSPLA